MIVYVYVSVYVYVYLYVCVCVCTSMYNYVLYIYIYVYVCMCRLCRIVATPIPFNLAELFRTQFCSACCCADIPKFMTIRRAKPVAFSQTW